MHHVRIVSFWSASNDYGVSLEADEHICLHACILTVLGFTNTSTLAGHFVPSSRQREKRDRRDSGEDEGRVGKKERNERK